MDDNSITLQEVKEKVRRFREKRDWGKYHNPKDLSISLMLEASELLEIFQWQSESEVGNTIRERSDEIRGELADILIYCFTVADHLDIGIYQSIIEKMEKTEMGYSTLKKPDVSQRYEEV